jgi:hypothetical protein
MEGGLREREKRDEPSVAALDQASGTTELKDEPRNADIVCVVVVPDKRDREAVSVTRALPVIPEGAREEKRTEHTLAGLQQLWNRVIPEKKCTVGY